MFKKKKDYDYFEYFIRGAENVCSAANFLHNTLADFEYDKINEYVEKMLLIEHRADSDKHEMIQNLLNEFITPIEREDISALAQQIDNVVDSIDDVILRIDMFKVNAISDKAIAFSNLIVNCCNELSKTMSYFKKFKTSKELKESIVAVNTYESEGDKLHAECIKELFEKENISSKDLIAWTKIYDELECCLDACEHSTDIIETVIMKNS